MHFNNILYIRMRKLLDVLVHCAQPYIEGEQWLVAQRSERRPAGGLISQRTAFRLRSLRTYRSSDR
jgi:hypothetical protein